MCANAGHAGPEYAKLCYLQFIWMTLPDSIDMITYVRAALEQGVAVVPGNTFLCDTEGTINAVRLNYSTPSDEDIVRGCEILAKVARDMLETK